MILKIQQEEYSLPITANDQPDFVSIETFYQQNCGNFWVAIDGEANVGTVALKNISKGDLIMSEVFDISFDKIEVIKDLWEKNRQYHEASSEYFSEVYRSICFDERIKAFGAFNQDALKITVAKDNGEYIGYCISTIVEGKGELESLHVDESVRGKGIGKELAVAHLEWMRENNCKVIGVTVSQENEAAINFYKKLGFYPNTLYMQQVQRK